MHFFEAYSQAIGLERDGQLIAGIIYENWNGKSVMVHIAVEGMLTRDFIAAIFDYAYRVCGVEKSIAPVVETNVKCRRMVENMGFIPEARLTDVHPEGDIILYTLRKSDCRFLGGYGHRKARALTASRA